MQQLLIASRQIGEKDASATLYRLYSLQCDVKSCQVTNMDRIQRMLSTRAFRRRCALRRTANIVQKNQIPISTKLSIGFTQNLTS